MKEKKRIFKGATYYVGSNKRKFKGSFKFDGSIEYSPTKLDTVYQAAKYVLPIFKKYKFNYFAVGGTLLGTIRHGGIIPWDSDIDLAITKKTYFRIIDLLDQLNKIDSEYYWANTSCPGIRIYYHKYAIIDLFVVDYIDEKHLAYSGSYDDNKKPTFEVHYYCFPKIKPLASKIFPTQWMKFEDLKIRVPKDPRHFLNLNYNKKFLKEIIKPSFKHKTIHEGIFDKQSFIPMQNWIINKSYKFLPNFYNFALKKTQQKFGTVFKDYGVEEIAKKKNKINYLKLCYETPIAITVAVFKMGLLNTINWCR